MDKPSPTLLKQQAEIKQLQKQADSLLQTIQHRSSEARAAQLKFDAQQKRFKTETERLIEEQQGDIKVALVPLQTEKADLEKSIDRLQVDFDERTAIYVSQETDIKRLDMAISNNIAKIKDGEQTLAVIQAEIAQQQRENGTLTAQKLQLQTDIAELTRGQSVIEEELPLLIAQKAHLEEDIADKQVESEKITIDRQLKVQALEAQSLKLAQDMEMRIKEDVQTREDLAKRQKMLDERDRNLRIRESKVEMGEGKIIQNANLMNL